MIRSSYTHSNSVSSPSTAYDPNSLVAVPVTPMTSRYQATDNFCHDNRGCHPHMIWRSDCFVGQAQYSLQDRRQLLYSSLQPQSSNHFPHEMPLSPHPSSLIHPPSSSADIHYGYCVMNTPADSAGNFGGREGRGGGGNNVWSRNESVIHGKIGGTSSKKNPHELQAGGGGMNPSGTKSGKRIKLFQSNLTDNREIQSNSAATKSNCKTSIKQTEEVTQKKQPENRRRVRHNFTSNQSKSLEDVFDSVTHYPDFSLLTDLSRKLKLPVERIQVWFQNRRAKFRRNSMLTKLL